MALVHPHAGHGIGTYPSPAAGVRFTTPAIGAVLDPGGSRAANAAARGRSWPGVLAFTAENG